MTLSGTQGMNENAYVSWIRGELFEQAPLNISVLDPDRRIVETNENFARLFGEGRGRPCWEVYKRRDEPCEACAVVDTFKDGKVRIEEGVAVDLAGNSGHYLVHVAPIYAEDGSIPFVIEMSTDISETKRLRDDYQTLFEQVPCYVTVLDRDLEVIRANGMFQAKFGEPAGDRCFRMFKRREDECPDCPTMQTFADGGTHTSEQVGISKDGKPTHYIVTTAPASRDEDGFSHVIEMALDVTELRAVQREKIDAERLAAVGQTVAGLAHGIKNILTGLEGGMYFLKSGLEGGRKERLAEGWEMLQRNTARISELSKNLLSFSKGRVPKVEMNAPGDLVADVLELYREAAAKQGVAVSAEIEEGVRPAPLDAEAIHMCLTNLVSNAVDACRMGEAESCRVTLRVREEADSLVFEVQDEGCGMDQKLRDLAFTNFFTTKGTGGTGLGLLHTRKITQEHGGQIEFESEPGVGSTFRLIFPRDRLPALGTAGKE